MVPDYCKEVLNDFVAVCHQRTPLHMAADRGSADTLRYLVKKGADVNTKDDCSGVSC